MNPMYRFAVIFFLGSSINACSTQQSIPACASNLSPVFSVPPRLPPKLHNEFEGRAVIFFIVDREGRVQSPAVASSEWHPLGRTRSSSVGYNDVILSAVQQWRYPPQVEPCRHQAPFEFKFNEGLNPLAGRSNNSFKPKPLRGSA